MNWLTVAQAAKQEGVSAGRIKALLAQHRIAGAKKHGPVWMIPADFKVQRAPKRNRGMAKIGRRPAAT